MREMSFSEFAGAMRTSANSITRELRRELKTAGELVATEARALAPSDKVRETIKVRTRTYTAIVEAGGEDVPEAYLLEKGNAGSGPTATEFRHPVFGGDVWVTQPLKRYLGPALAANREKAGRAMRDAIGRSFPDG